MLPDGVRNSPPVAVCMGTNVKLVVGVGAVFVVGVPALVLAAVGAVVTAVPPGDALAGPPPWAAGDGRAGGATRPFEISLMTTSETASTITAAMAVSGAAHRCQRPGARLSARSAGRGASRSGGA